MYTHTYHISYGHIPKYVSGAGPVKYTRTNQCTRGVSRKGTCECRVASHPVSSNGISFDPSGVLTGTG